MSATAQTTNQWNYLGCPGIAPNAYTKMAMSSTGEPYILSKYSNELTVKKFDGYAWTKLGSTVFDLGNSLYLSITVDKNNVPYVAFSAYVGGSPARLFIVKKYNGTNWVTIKQDTVNTYDISISSDANNGIYLAYKGGNLNGLTVEKYINNSWTVLGGAPVASNATAYYPVLEIDRNNNPVVAYRDRSAGNKLTVYRYNGSGWTIIGTQGFTAGDIHTYISLAFNKNNVPYVAFRDYFRNIAGSILTVMKYNGTNWVNVGNTASERNPDYLSIMIDSNDAPIVSYRKYVSSLPGASVSVMKYDGINWINLASHGDMQYGDQTQAGLDPNNRIYIGYYDKNVTNYNFRYSVKVYDSTLKYTKIRPHGPTTICNGGSVVLSIQSCGDDDTIQWYRNGTAISAATSDVYTATTSGSYSVSITSGSNTTYFDPLTVNVYNTSVSISSVLANNTYTGGNANTIYFGYGPQSATLTATGSGSTGFTYSWSPAVGLSCTNCQSPVFTPTAADNYTYTVTATSVEGCTNTATISFCVLDVRDVKNNSTKIYVCHNGKTNTVSASAVATHLQHGDALGMCEQSCNAAAKGGKTITKKEAEEEAASPIERVRPQNAIKVYPNPASNMVTIESTTEINTVEVYDVTGKKLISMNTSDRKVQINIEQLAAAVYMVKLNNLDVIRIMKQ